MQTDYREVNFDGLVGPLHNYAGLSPGNVASESSADSSSNPHAAARQGLEKMRWLSSQGLYQALLPPHRRPAWNALRSLGFEGSTEAVLESAGKVAPHLLAACCSSSAMWTANAATLCPSHDSEDKRLHFVPANLSSNFHRSLEAPVTAAVLKTLFASPSHFVHHPPLPSTPLFSDEGAANHTRICSSHGEPGFHLFVYGRDHSDRKSSVPQRYPARQTLESCQALARLLHIPPERSIFIQQSPEAIDAGVFHNDVISTGNENLFLYHERAFFDADTAIGEMEKCYQDVCQGRFHPIKVPSAAVSLTDAIQSYLFNSQILTLAGGRMLLLAPEECQKNSAVRTFIEDILIPGHHPLDSVVYLDLRQSMANGGGPACLRLRMVLSEEERALIPDSVWMTEERLVQLEAWVDEHYRRELHARDLTDPALHEEARVAFDALEDLLGFRLPEVDPPTLCSKATSRSDARS